MKPQLKALFKVEATRARIEEVKRDKARCIAAAAASSSSLSVGSGETELAELTALENALWHEFKLSGKTTKKNDSEN